MLQNSLYLTCNSSCLAISSSINELTRIYCNKRHYASLSSIRKFYSYFISLSRYLQIICLYIGNPLINYLKVAYLQEIERRAGGYRKFGCILALIALASIYLKYESNHHCMPRNHLPVRL